jgi:hypothetical protein
VVVRTGEAWCRVVMVLGRGGHRSVAGAFLFFPFLGNSRGPRPAPRPNRPTSDPGRGAQPRANKQ